MRWLTRWLTSNTVIAVALVIAVGIASFTTWFFLSKYVAITGRPLILGLIGLNAAATLGSIALVGLRLWQVWRDRRNQQAGSQTYMRLAGVFALVAVLPSIFALLFTLTILRTSFNDDFSARLNHYHGAARAMANVVRALDTSVFEGLANQLASDIRRNEELGAGFEAGPVSFRNYLLYQALIRQFSAIHIFSPEGRIILRAEVEPHAYAPPPKEKFDELKSKPAGGMVIGVNNDATYDMYRVATKIEDYGGAILVFYRRIDPNIAANYLAVVDMRASWPEAQRARSRRENVFAIGYSIFTIIVLSAAVWLALWAATGMVRPIGRLMRMAGRVSSGDLGARVEIYKDDGELGALARSMNHMTAQLQTQRNDLIETNRQFDRRRRFTEAVLSGVSAGVVGVSSDGRVSIVNRFASELLGLDEGRERGSRIEEIFPEIQGLLEEAGGDDNREAADQLEIDRGGRKRTLNVRIVADEVEGELSYVVTFDDITQLISAQRSAAWGDVARRIAHEIKNPLTPIQLSAERLRRKYLNEISSQPEIFDKCTETIIRHVTDIGRMVDEFSSFARMPKPVMGREDLRELVRAAIFTQRVAHTEIDYLFDAADAPRLAQCDGRLIVQALSNLLKNAAESINARLSDEDADRSPGKIAVAILEINGNWRIDVLDNGVGLPKAERHRLTEPYMTTRAKGTGLGLAIVRKVIEDHGGYLEYDDERSLGPTGARVSIALPVAKNSDASAPMAAAAAE